MCFSSIVPFCVVLMFCSVYIVTSHFISLFLYFFFSPFLSEENIKDRMFQVFIFLPDLFLLSFTKAVL